MSQITAIKAASSVSAFARYMVRVVLLLLGTPPVVAGEQASISRMMQQQGEPANGCA